MWTIAWGIVLPDIVIGIPTFWYTTLGIFSVIGFSLRPLRDFVDQPSTVSRQLM